MAEIEEGVPIRYDDLDAIHVRAIDEHRIGAQAVHRNHKMAYEDILFLHGGDGQWDDKELRSRKSRGAPTLTVNGLQTFVNRVVGDMLLNSPALKSIPVDQYADKSGAHLIDGLMRNISRGSKSDRVFKAVGKQSVGHGFGYMEVFTEYNGKESFEQDIKFRKIKNSFSVIPDPDAEDITLADQNYCFIEKRMTRDAFKRKYPGEQITDFAQARQKYGEYYSRWFMVNEVLVAKYYKRFEREIDIIQLENGMILNADDLENDPVLAEQVKDLRVIKNRKSKYYEVYSYIMSGDKVLSGPHKIMSSMIPVVKVSGQTLEIGDYTITAGLIRHAKDAQRMKNFWMSTIAESLTNAPKTPYMATPAHVKGYEDIWATANRYNYSYLPFNVDPQAPGIIPQRTPPAFLPDGAFVQFRTMGEEIKNTTGLFESSLGQKSNERTGAAIEARERSSDIGTFEFIDNLNDAIQQVGAIILEMIPNVFDTNRVVKILGEDQKTIEMVELNRRYFDPADSKNILTDNDMSIGKYDVAVEVGPNFTTQREETARKMIDFMQILNDQQRAVLVDMIPRHLGFNGSNEMADRLEKLLPPGIKAQEPGEPPPEPPQPSPAEQNEARKLEVEAEKNEVASAKNEVEMAKVQVEAARVAQEAEDEDARTREIVFNTLEEIEGGGVQEAAT